MVKQDIKNSHLPSFWNWKPLISVGDINFNELAQPVILRYCLRKLKPDCDTASWETYEFSDQKIKVYVKNAHIDSVGCFENLYYQGRNIIGMSIKEIREVLGEPDEIGGKDIGGRSNDYEKLGISLFEEDGEIVSGICSASWED